MEYYVFFVISYLCLLYLCLLHFQKRLPPPGVTCLRYLLVGVFPGIPRGLLELSLLSGFPKVVGAVAPEPRAAL